MHSFLVPVLGHERGFRPRRSAPVLGVFAVAVAVVRLVHPLIAQHLREGSAGGCMRCGRPACSRSLPVRARRLGDGPGRRAGLALGAVQPMIIPRCQLTPPDRHGEAIALRSMTINFSSALMPLLFSALGAGCWRLGAVLADGVIVGAGSCRRAALSQAAPLRT